MTDKGIIKLKLALVTVSLVFFITGSKLLFDEWTSIHLSFWVLIGLLAYGGVYRTFKGLHGKNIQTIFTGFELAGTITFVFASSFGTIMLLIFYRHISLLFIGLTLVTLSVFGGLKFITFDFNQNKVDGLFEKQESTVNMTVDIHPGNNQIEIKTADRPDVLFIKREKYSDKVWTFLIDNFQRIKVRI